MTARLLDTVLIGVVIGPAAVTLNPLQSAPAPDPRPQQWENKVASVSGNARGDANPADGLAEQSNGLAKDGGEYSGSVVSDSIGRGSAGGGPQYVAFRRFKP